MNILHVVSSHIDSGPGAACLRQMLALRAAGLETTLACIPGKSLEANAKQYKFRVIDDLTFVRDAKLWQLPGARRKFLACVKDNKFDLVHLHQSPEMLLAQLALANENVGAIRSWHDTSVGLGAETLRMFLQKPKREVLGSSNAVTLLLRKKLAKRATQIDWLPAPVDCAVFTPDLRTQTESMRAIQAIRVDNNLDAAFASGVLIGIPGRIAERRGIFTAFEALKMLGTRIPWAAMFFGQGEDADKLRQLIMDSGKSGQIKVFDSIDNWPIRMAASDITLVLRPGSDGAARAVIEAMACGTPCVVGNEGGLTDFTVGIPGRWPEEASATPAQPGSSGIQTAPAASGTRAMINPAGSGLAPAPGGGTRMLTNPAGSGSQPAPAAGSPPGGAQPAAGLLPGARGTTRIIGAPERMTATLGALAVDNTKPADIAKGLARVIDDLHRRQQMRDAAHATALRRYDMTAIGKRLKEQYRKMVGFGS